MNETDHASPAGDPRPAPSYPLGDRAGNAALATSPCRTSAAHWIDFDLPGVSVGTAEYAQGPTGCTVVRFDRRARTAVDVRGGSPGVSGLWDANDAICLAGGSSYGLQAAGGVAAELLDSGQRGVGWDQLAEVSGAIIYDFLARDTAVVPDAAVGRAAVQWATPRRIPVGRAGAGVCATVGKLIEGRAEFGGQGAAFGVHGDVRLLVLTVVNALGVIVDRDGRVVRGNLDPASGRRETYRDPLRLPAAAARGNTTLTVLVTNAQLASRQLTQLARTVHGSMHRAISPFHTENDGDVLFAVTTDDVSYDGNTTGLAIMASELTWDAVLASVR